MVNMNILSNPYNWIIVILMLALGSMGFMLLTKQLGISS